MLVTLPRKKLPKLHPDFKLNWRKGDNFGRITESGGIHCAPRRFAQSSAIENPTGFRRAAARDRKVLCRFRGRSAVSAPEATALAGPMLLLRRRLRTGSDHSR